MVSKQTDLTVFVRSNCFSNSAFRAMDIPNNVPVDILIDGETIDEHSTFADYENYIEHIDSIEMKSINREMNIKVTTDGYVECYPEE